MDEITAKDPFLYHVFDPQKLIDGVTPYWWPIDADSIKDVQVGTYLINDDHAGIFQVEDISVSQEAREGKLGNYYLLTIDIPGTGGGFDEMGLWVPLS